MMPQIFFIHSNLSPTVGQDNGLHPIRSVPSSLAVVRHLYPLRHFQPRLERDDVLSRNHYLLAGVWVVESAISFLVMGTPFGSSYALLRQRIAVRHPCTTPLFRLR